MKILHYTLGMPPFRTGGLTKYAVDLMKQQLENHDQVVCLFPGEIKKYNKEQKISYYKLVDGINVYKVINPLPVPLLEGIKEPHYYMGNGDKSVFTQFLKSQSVEILHIHTLMGLNIELLEACHDLAIKIIFTTHDYFGLCPKTNFWDSTDNACECRDFAKCSECNINGISYSKNLLIQSSLYQKIKNEKTTALVKGSLKLFPNFSESKKNIEKPTVITSPEGYKSLFEYHYKLFKLIDFFLYNSSIAEEKFSSYLNVKGKILDITHSSIVDKRSEKSLNTSTPLRLTYLGPYKKYKGFDLMIQLLNQISEEGIGEFLLDCYGDDIKIKINSKNTVFHSKYSYQQLNDILSITDLLIVPSQWKETFGFILLEALSFGVPVLVSDNVGAKDLLLKSNEDIGMIFNNDEAFRQCIKECIINPDILSQFKNNILEEQNLLKSMREHSLEIKNVYKELLADNENDRMVN